MAEAQLARCAARLRRGPGGGAQDTQPRHALPYGSAYARTAGPAEESTPLDAPPRSTVIPAMIIKLRAHVSLDEPRRGHLRPGDGEHVRRRIQAGQRGQPRQAGQDRARAAPELKQGRGARACTARCSRGPGRFRSGHPSRSHRTGRTPRSQASHHCGHRRRALQGLAKLATRTRTRRPEPGLLPSIGATVPTHDALSRPAALTGRPDGRAQARHADPPCARTATARIQVCGRCATRSCRRALRVGGGLPRAVVTHEQRPAPAEQARRRSWPMKLITPTSAPHSSRRRPVVAILVAVHQGPGDAVRVHMPRSGLPRTFVNRKQRTFNPWVQGSSPWRPTHSDLAFRRSGITCWASGMGGGWPGYGRCAGNGCCLASVAC